MSSEWYLVVALVLLAGMYLSSVVRKRLAGGKSGCGTGGCGCSKGGVQIAKRSSEKHE